jgi:hypothetical protein
MAELQKTTTEALPQVADALTPMMMIDRAVQSGASIEALERLMALQERWEANLGRKAFDNAIAQAKAEIPTIRKNRAVDFTSAKGRTNYRHEDLAEIAKTVDPILSRYGLSYRYRTTQEGGQVTVTCILSHRDGYSEETTLSSAPDQSGNKNHLQAVGSAATYLQRYTLKMALGLAASSDDDGTHAGAAPLINAEQYQVLMGLMEQAEADQEKMLAFLKAETLDELTTKQFDVAVGMLRKKIAQKGAGK